MSPRMPSVLDNHIIRKGRLNSVIGGIAVSFLIVLAAVVPYVSCSGQVLSGTARSHSLLPDQSCVPQNSWSPDENSAWCKISNGETADLHGKVLSPQFLKAILLDKEWKEKIAGKSIRIIGAIFEKDLIFEDADINNDLFLDCSTFKGEVAFIGSRINGYLSLKGSTFTDQDPNHNRINILRATSSVESLISLSGVTGVKEVNVFDSKIRSNIDLTKSTVEVLRLDSSSIDGHILIGISNIKGVHISVVEVGRNLDLTNSRVSDEIIINDTHINGVLLMRDYRLFLPDGKYDQTSRYASYMQGSKDDFLQPFVRNIKIRNVVIGKTLEMAGIQVDEALSVSDSHIGETIDLRSSVLGKELNITSSTINISIDMSDSSIESTLPEDFKFDLRGTTYSTGFGGFGKKITESNVEDYKELLNHFRYYSPQPYQQLAHVLTQSGFKAEANAILYESQKQQENEYWKRLCNDSFDHQNQSSLWPWRWNWSNFLVWFWQFFLHIFIGYGYYPWYIIRPVVVLVITGIFFLQFCHQTKSHQNKEERIVFSQIRWRRIIDEMFFSIDFLIPVIKLRKKNYEIDLEPSYVRWYFYIHRIMGFVLASILVAWLTGLISK